MNKKAIISIMAALTLAGYPMPGSAHTIVDNHPEMEKQAKEVMEQVESYMKDKYQVSLNEEMTIVNTYDYEEDVKTYKLKDATYAIKYSAAVSVPSRNLIILNMQIVTPEAYRFFLTHELVHKYQAIKAKEEQTTMNKNVGLAEGMADIIAEDLTSICLESKDRGIPRNELATPEDFKKAVKTYGETEVYEQARYEAEMYRENHPKSLYEE